MAKAAAGGGAAWGPAQPRADPSKQATTRAAGHPPARARFIRIDYAGTFRDDGRSLCTHTVSRSGRYEREQPTLRALNDAGARCAKASRGTQVPPRGREEAEDVVSVGVRGHPWLESRQLQASRVLA